jgi:hypothetical protein
MFIVQMQKIWAFGGSLLQFRRPLPDDIPATRTTWAPIRIRAGQDTGWPDLSERHPAERQNGEAAESSPPFRKNAMKAWFSRDMRGAICCGHENGDELVATNTYVCLSLRRRGSCRVQRGLCLSACLSFRPAVRATQPMMET